MLFCKKMECVSTNRKTKIVLALDFPFGKLEDYQSLFLKAEYVLEAANPYICAIKVNHHLILPMGLFDGVQQLVKKAHDLGIMTIMDCKANDVGSTNEVIAEYYYAAGFDAIITNPFVGWADGVMPIFKVARRSHRGVLLLVYMSHKGANEGYGQTIFSSETGKKLFQYSSFAKKVLEWGADGAIVGATRPEKIRDVHEILDEIPIYSPGIGFQGGRIKAAVEAGARYLIVGRAITLAENPGAAAKKIRDIAES